jgi:protein-export chaperone SecB
MSKENLNTQENANPQFSVITQYLKDLSFECPKPTINLDEKAIKVDISVGLSTKEIEKDIYEISLKLNGEAKINDDVVFLADINYAGQFIMKNIPDEQKEMLIGIEVPNLLFPFARRILMTTITDSGLRTPQIEPINFAHLFMQARQENK